MGTDCCRAGVKWRARHSQRRAPSVLIPYSINASECSKLRGSWRSILLSMPSPLLGSGGVPFLLIPSAGFSQRFGGALARRFGATNDPSVELALVVSVDHASMIAL